MTSRGQDTKSPGKRGKYHAKATAEQVCDLQDRYDVFLREGKSETDAKKKAIESFDHDNPGFGRSTLERLLNDRARRNPLPAGKIRKSGGGRKLVVPENDPRLQVISDYVNDLQLQTLSGRYRG